MENKISLVYENGEFTVYINDEVVTVNKYMDNANREIYSNSA